MIKFEDRVKRDSYRKKNNLASSFHFFFEVIYSYIAPIMHVDVRLCQSVALAIEKTLLECHPGHGQDDDRRETDHGSISPTFYEQLLRAYISKAQKGQSSHQSYSAFGIYARKSCALTCWCNRPQD